MSGDVRRGGCLCGAVRFEVTPPPRFVAHCHCKTCSRAHGAGVVTWAGFPDERFRVSGGEPALRHYRTETDATRSFCSICGTTMLYRSPRWSGEVHVALACLDDSLDELPSGHAYADRAAAWLPILDDLPRFGGEDGTQRLEQR